MILSAYSLRLAVVSVLVAGGANALLAATGAESDPAKVQEILTALESKIDGLGWDDGAEVIENAGWLESLAEFQMLRQMMDLHAREIVAATLQGKLSGIRKSLLITSSHGLAGTDYVDLLTTFLSAAEGGVLTHQEMRWALFPTPSSNARKWKDNWQDPRVREVAQRAAALFDGEADMQTYFSQMLSGDIERRSAQVRSAMTNPPPTPDGLPPSVQNERSAPGEAAQTEVLASSLDRPTIRNQSSPNFLWWSLALVLGALLMTLIVRRRLR